MSEKKEIPPWFWLVSIIAIFWNLMGVANYLMLKFMSPEVMAKMSEAEQALIENTPAWVTAAFATAVFSGLAGSVLMILRKKIAFETFALSMAAIVVQEIYVLFMSDTLKVQGVRGVMLPFMIITLGLIFLAFSYFTRKQGILK